MPLDERRRSQRFNFGVPLTVQWSNGSERRSAHTITQDVSSGGVFFFLPEAIPDGTAVEIEMTLPAQITLGTPVRVRCQGRIQRCVLTPGESTGMATMIEKYEFLSSNEEVA
jgi:PilZ domain